MTITILCAGALALPGGSDERARPALLEQYAPSETGAAARLLGRARAPKARRDDAPVPREFPDETWLREQFAPAPGDSIAAFAMHAHAALPTTVAAALDAAGIEAPRLLVRPVHLHVGLDQLVLAPPDGIEAAEAHALADAATRHFADDGLRWSADSPQAWTLRARGDAGVARLAGWSRLRCRSARLAAGRSIDAWQPEGDAARSWRALTGELQMLWHEHPVNQAREAAGRPTINSIWLEGRCTTPARRPFDAVITADDSVAGLALSAGSEVSAVPQQATADDLMRFAAIQEGAETLLVDPGWWRVAVARVDAAAWQQGWANLDALLERLASIGQGPDTIVLAGERDLLEFERRGSDRWALWRSRRLAELLAAHG